ncbi:formate dehydrogenase accessory sulfurtransferase FdhD [Ramlibacter sp. G-1-2-2]|uniref:Sulfur carrier protein FdhD n=1 Tax=Ramlibacter agri TaxID=2728837 RepID=A0A848H6M2_9BURK|nr:formate dehydrogenase accessory sulfurtransferase FdhD [Ramlibacter agri]NML46626.1 formate dehydrogenase accessory sulfurtransferase FdhD [Ramlibacter agri]
MKPFDAPLAPPAGVRALAVSQRRGAELRETQDWVAEEVPVALEYNGLSHAVMLATPADLEDFALGFSFTEDLVDSPSDVRDIEVVEGELGITVRLEIASSCFVRLKERRRSLAGRTGCGLCGAESLPQAVRRPPVLQSAACFDAIAVRLAMEALRERQPLHAASGASHAAAFADCSGALRVVREDVGRHNALDKLAGAMLRERRDASSGFVAVTSRASYEMAGKTARLGAPLLAAVSGVTALAVEVSEEAGLCLAGFARGDSLNLYAHPQRIRHGK